MKKLFFILVVLATIFVSCKKEKDSMEILSGTIAPAATIGNDGDFYLDNTTNILYGPKTSGAWGNGIRLTGRMLSGDGAPNTSLGIVGDYYLDNTNYLLYGPKAANGWGAGLQLGAPCEIYLFSNPYKYVGMLTYGQLEIPFSLFNYSAEKSANTMGLVYIESDDVWQLANGTIGFTYASLNARYNFDESNTNLYIYIQPINGDTWQSEDAFETGTRISRVKIVIVPAGKVNTITGLKDKSLENVMRSLAY